MTFTYSFWILFLLVAGVVVLLVLGFTVFRSEKHFNRQSLCFAIALLCGVLFAFMASAHLDIKDGHIIQGSQDLVLDSVASIDITLREEGWGRGRHVEEVWVVNFRNGWRQYIYPSDLWRMNMGVVVDTIPAHGIRMRRVSELDRE